MGLPFYLAMNAAEIAASVKLPPMAWMSCHFSPCSEGLTNLPLWLPEGSLIIVDDRFPCGGHRGHAVAEELSDTVRRFHCAGIILDFQQPDSGELRKLVPLLLEALPCPVAVSDLYAPPHRCAVFLSPGPLWEAPGDHWRTWSDREIWLDASLCLQKVSVTPDGLVPGAILPWDGNGDGFFDEALCCQYRTHAETDSIHFTFFDTPETMAKKLDLAQQFGATRAVGLWREMRTFLLGK